MEHYKKEPHMRYVLLALLYLAAHCGICTFEEGPGGEIIVVFEEGGGAEIAEEGGGAE